jgi:undecaprenyl-diphosphatase
MSTFNIAVFRFIHNFSGRNIFLDGLGIFFAEWLPYLLVLGFLVLVLYEQGSRRKVYLFVEGALAVILSRGIITTAIHFFYYHARPFVYYGISPLISESGSSFPSAHAAWFFALAMTVWYANRKWGWWYFFLATLMGIARIYAGVHWPLDIIVGAVIGIASAMFVRWLLKDFRNQLTTSQPSASSPAEKSGKSPR